jgi:hypothetical protein
MRRVTFASIFIPLAVLTVVGNQMLKAREGALVTAFGISTGRSVSGARSESVGAYFNSAQTDLRAFLLTNGFAASPRQTYGNWAGVRTYQEKEEIYRGTFHNSLPFDVILSIPEGNATGVAVNVSWYYYDYSWRVTASKAKAEAFAQVLTKWWNDYQEVHPVNTVLPGIALPKAELQRARQL